MRVVTLLTALAASPMAAEVPLSLAHGWAEVDVPSGMTFDRDEIIGWLVDTGTPRANIRWFKPFYGPQNIALIDEPFETGEARVLRFVAEDSPVEGEATPCGWRSAGYTQHDFTYRAFVLGKIPITQTLLYWGTEPDRHASELSALLEELTERCKED